MTTNLPFGDPILTTRRDGKNIPYIDILEVIYVSQGQAILTEIPSEFYRVKIMEQVGGSNSSSTTVDGGSFTNGNITNNGSEIIVSPSYLEIIEGYPDDNEYLVDYLQGVITFNSSQEGAKFLVSYKGTGYHYFPSQRIYYKQNLDGTITSLENVLDSSTDTINNIQSSINNANQATTNANQATAAYQSLLNQQLIIYKPNVATFVAIATTYPTPSLGWRVVAKDTGLAYRFDGTSWVEADVSTAGDGFNVSISEVAPANINMLWLNVPNVNRNSRIVKSSTPPADTSVIWWEP